MSERLACAVLSLGAQPGLVGAVKSVLDQEPRPELVVVNSGGGDPAAALAGAGLDVPLVDEPERLYAGGARNRGIEATSARYVAFLAADSHAEPGWVAGRLRAHAAGADAVACALTSPPGASRSASAAHLLQNWRRLPSTPPSELLLFGLSYDRALFDRFGLFSEDLRVGEDSEFNQRIRESATIAWAPDVRTQHPGASRPRQFLVDQHRRGRRRAQARRRMYGPEPARKLVADAVMNPTMALRHARQTPDAREREALLRGWPMLVPGSLAYLAGGIFGPDLVRITFLGHAGLFIETAAGTILCDPWFNPAYFGAWFPFPSNESIDPKAIGQPDYLYVSHSHRDHLDPAFLAEHVSKDATVVLPDYPVDHLERELRGLGFHRFLKTNNSEPVESDGLRFAIMALVAPSDGPTGDSALVVDDGTTRILNQNDAHPVDLEPIQALGPFHGHFLQFSGAIWFPMVYAFPQKMKDALGRRKRNNEQDRALRYAEEIDASHVFPCAGPPAFLDPELFHLNDFDNDPTNIFCDQPAFLSYMAEHGSDRGELVVPGTTIELEGDACSVTQPQDAERPFADKRAYLEEYAARKRPVIEATRAAWPTGEWAVQPALRDWFEPLLEMADLTCDGVAARVLLDLGAEQIVVDFLDRRVYAWNGEECRYRFRIDRRLVEACIADGEEDWVNSLFLSCRFEADRDGKYNEYVYNFFKCLSPERLQYAEGYYAEQSRVDELWRCDGYLVQRRCPHLKADLARFGEVEDGVLTCTMHGWRFDLATGRCLTSDGARIYSEPAPPEPS